MRPLAITARLRHDSGKGAARKLRRDNQLPAIFYGPRTEPMMLAVDYPELTRVIKQGKGENMVLDLKVKSDQGEETRKAMLKDLMVDPVSGTYIHADFYEISMDKEITVDIPIRLINTPAGVTEGGFLQTIRRELTVSCLPDRIIDSLEIDVAGLEIGEAVHIRDIELPEGISCAEEGHLTVAVVSAPGGGMAGDEEEPEEGLEEVTAASGEESAEESKEAKKGGEQ
ncbi:MAG TPA: 50S ribosomal protein L25 [Deltaproteobacteria bacterium]|nr:50S ribosomal protein L25 [Deltaproteobacteria bacterium]